MEFEQVYRDYFQDVYLYILRLSGNESIAEEITSETFFKALQSVDRFRGDCDIRVWLCQIAKNAYFTYLKKSSRLTSMEDGCIQTLSSPGTCMEEQLAAHDYAAQIQRCLHLLPNPYKEIFMWRVFAGLSFKQIGQLFNKSDNWACVTYHRARTMLRKQIGGNQE